MTEYKAHIKPERKPTHPGAVLADMLEDTGLSVSASTATNSCAIPKASAARSASVAKRPPIIEPSAIPARKLASMTAKASTLPPST